MSQRLDRWLGRLQPSTAEVSGQIFDAWMRWLRGSDSSFSSFSPDELVLFQEENPASYELLDVVQEYIRSKGGRVGYKKRVYSGIRSFFMHNRAELPRDAGFSIQGDKGRVVGSLTVEEFKLVLGSCNPMYRALYLCMFQGGMGVGEVLFWNENGLESLQSQLRANGHHIKIDLPGRKKMRNIRPFYTFIGKDALEVLAHWMEARPNNSEYIFVTNRGKPVTYDLMQLYWIRKLKRLGIIKPKHNGDTGSRYGKNLHELRDLFRSRWEKSGSSDNAAEFFLGHVVDPLEYNKAFRDADYALREYRKAEPWLNILSDDPEKIPRENVKELQLRIFELEREKNSEIDMLRSQMDVMRDDMARDSKILKFLYDKLKEE